MYVHRKNWDAAYSLAETFPHNISYTRGILMADLKYSAGEITDQRKYHCLNVKQLASKLGHETAMLGNLYMHEGHLDDALYCYAFLRNIVEAMYTKEQYRPPFHDDYYPMYRFPAECLMKLGREDEAIQLLEDGVAFILAQAKNYNKKRYLHIPLLRDLSFGYGYDGNTEYHDLSGKLKRFVECDTFKSLENDSRYRALVKKVTSIK